MIRQTMLTDDEFMVVLHGKLEDIKRTFNCTNVNYNHNQYMRCVWLIAVCSSNPNIKVLDYLMSIGANIHAVDCDGENAIYTAVRSRAPITAIKYLIDHKVDPNTNRTVYNDEYGQSPIDFAITTDQVETTYLLYCHGCQSSLSHKIRMLILLRPYLACNRIAYTILGIRKFRSSVLNTNDKHIALLIAKEITRTRKDFKWNKVA
jgi:ankyrin repeat protein